MPKVDVTNALDRRIEIQLERQCIVAKLNPFHGGKKKLEALLAFRSSESEVRIPNCFQSRSTSLELTGLD